MYPAGLLDGSCESVIKKPENPCFWLPREEVSAFVDKALQAKAFLDAAALLLLDKKVPAEIWIKLDSGKTSNEDPLFNGNVIETEFDIAIQKMFLTSIMNKHLRAVSTQIRNSITWWQPVYLIKTHVETVVF